MSGNRLTMAQKLEMIFDAQLGTAALMKKYNVSYSTVRRILGDRIILTNPPKLNEETKRQIINEPRKTKLKILAHKYNVSMATICKVRMYKPEDFDAN